MRYGMALTLQGLYISQLGNSSSASARAAIRCDGTAKYSMWSSQSVVTACAASTSRRQFWQSFCLVGSAIPYPPRDHQPRNRIPASECKSVALVEVQNHRNKPIAHGSLAIAASCSRRCFFISAWAIFMTRCCALYVFAPLRVPPSRSATTQPQVFRFACAFAASFARSVRVVISFPLRASAQLLNRIRRLAARFIGGVRGRFVPPCVKSVVGFPCVQVSHHFVVAVNAPQ